MSFLYRVRLNVTTANGEDGVCHRGSGKMWNILRGLKHHFLTFFFMHFATEVEGFKLAKRPASSHSTVEFP